MQGLNPGELGEITYVYSDGDYSLKNLTTGVKVPDWVKPNQVVATFSGVDGQANAMLAALAAAQKEAADDGAEFDMATKLHRLVVAQKNAVVAAAKRHAAAEEATIAAAERAQKAAAALARAHGAAETLRLQIAAEQKPGATPACGQFGGPSNMPDLRGEVQLTLDQYRGREPELARKLVAKYGAQVRSQQGAAASAAAVARRRLDKAARAADARARALAEARATLAALGAAQKKAAAGGAGKAGIASPSKNVQAQAMLAALAVRQKAAAEEEDSAYGDGANFDMAVELQRLVADQKRAVVAAAERHKAAEAATAAAAARARGAAAALAQVQGADATLQLQIAAPGEPGFASAVVDAAGSLARRKRNADGTAAKATADIAAAEARLLAHVFPIDAGADPDAVRARRRSALLQAGFRTATTSGADAEGVRLLAAARAGGLALKAHAEKACRLVAFHNGTVKAMAARTAARAARAADGGPCRERNEVKYAALKRKAMVAVPLEPGCRDPAAWGGAVAAALPPQWEAEFSGEMGGRPRRFTCGCHLLCKTCSGNGQRQGGMGRCWGPPHPPSCPLFCCCLNRWRRDSTSEAGGSGTSRSCTEATPWNMPLGVAFAGMCHAAQKWAHSE